MLTGKEIIEKGIITNYCEEGIQQQGVDLRIKRIRKVASGNNIPLIPKEGKTKLPEYEGWDDWSDKFCLSPGYYEVEFMEGCNIPKNCAMWLKTRSSLVRCGATVHSGQFDAGFNTENAGCFLEVRFNMDIELHARIAQAILFTSNDVDNLYDGQWQGDKQRL